MRGFPLLCAGQSRLWTSLIRRLLAIPGDASFSAAVQHYLRISAPTDEKPSSVGADLGGVGVGEVTWNV